MYLKTFACSRCVDEGDDCQVIPPRFSPIILCKRAAESLDAAPCLQIQPFGQFLPSRPAALLLPLNRKVRQLQPAVVKRYRQSLHDRIERAGIELSLDDERLVKEVIFFADKSDISEELTRLESHFAQFAHHLRKNEPVGRTLEFMCQEIGREFNTLGAKANDVEISQLVVMCKAEMEKIREQIQNIE